MAEELQVENAWTFAEVERLRHEWDAVPWEREEAELAFLLARARARPETREAFAIFVRRRGLPVAALAGRIEERRLETRIGYRTVYAPRVRLLHVVDGGIVGADDAAVATLARALDAALVEGSLDVATIPPLAVDSPLFAALNALPGRLRSQLLLEPWPRRRLVLPGSFEQFLASRSQNTRWQARRDARRLVAAFGDELRVEVLDRADQLEQLVVDLDRIGRLTYQRALGAGFADTAEQRALTSVGLEHGWLRAHVLYRREHPVAYWLCSLHRGTTQIRATGFDPAYGVHRVGTYLLLRLIEDACADPRLEVLDFGPGDARYKQQFSSESHLERNLVLFAPTVRARRINALRTAVLAAARLARRGLDAVELTDRVTSLWRRRIRGS